MSRARVLFAGTPEFSVPALQSLFDADVEVAAVWCQPDRPAGRGRGMRMCPVKERALDLGIPVMQPATLRDPGSVQQIEEQQADLMVVVAYGLLLPRAVLAAPRLGCVNVHASLLPRWRGAAPIQRAIEAGDPETGITLMQMDAGLDTGPMLATAGTAIESRETGGSLHDRLAALGAGLLADSLPAILDGTLEAVAQDDALACYAAKIDKREARIDWGEDAVALERRIRAFDPWPVCETGSGRGRLRIWAAEAIGDVTAESEPGTILSAGDSGIEVACGRGTLTILELQRDGGRRMSAAEFLRGTPVGVGAGLA